MTLHVKLATIDNLAVDIFMENSYVIGSDPYLNDALWARKKREAENKQLLPTDTAEN